MKKKILIVEDNLILCGMLKKWLAKAGYEVMSASDEPFARKLVQKNDFSLILSDVRLPEGDGINLLEWMCRQNMDTPFVVMTEYASFPDAVRAVRLGAKDYLPKPVHQEPLLNLLHSLLKSPAVTRGNRIIQERTSPEAKKTELLARRVALSEMSVLILGPNGSGKEIVAQTIHRNSNRKDKPFVAVNCGGIPKELAASEFFGYVKGAFTGADADTKGYFETAAGGTLFLDEIGNMSHEVQALLLRVLQERVYSPVGSRRTCKADVRIIAATNEDMHQAILDGRFREDLYYRLAEVEIRQPSLGECREDILSLADFFRSQASLELKRETDGFTREAEAILLSYGWPGNVRELFNRVRRAVLLSDSPLLSPEDLGFDESQTFHGTTTNNIIERLRNDEKEKANIMAALEEAHGNITCAAGLLGVSRRTLYNKIEKYGLR